MPHKTHMPAVGNEVDELVASIKAKRKALGISVIDIAEWEGIKVRTAYNYLKGLCLSEHLPHRPGRRILRRILGLLVKIETGGISSIEQAPDAMPVHPLQGDTKMRVMLRIDSINSAAKECGVTHKTIANYIGVSLRTFYLWAAGVVVPSNEHYGKLLEVQQLLLNNPEALKL